MPGDPDPVALPAAWSSAGAAVAVAYDLCLYVSGHTPLSARAIVNIRRLCDTHLAGRYTLEIVDITQQPKRVRTDQIVATPTLLRRLPLPARRFIGDLSETARVLERLDITPSR